VVEFALGHVSYLGRTVPSTRSGRREPVGKTQKV
jgi:hypothetical protein